MSLAPHDGGLERLAETCVRHGWRLGIVTDDHTSPLQLAYLEVRGRRPERELLARSPVTTASVDEACGDVEVSLKRQGLLTR